MHTTSFKLGTFSIEDGRPFPAMVFDPEVERDEMSPRAPGARIVPLHRLKPLLRATGTVLSGADSLPSLLDGWPENLRGLTRLCAAAYPEILQLSFAEIDARTHSPIAAPRQIFCTVANYRRQITESVVDAGAPPHTDGMDQDQRRSYAARVIEARLKSPPYVCFKLPTTVIGPSDSLELPRRPRQIDWEIELGVVIGRPCRCVSREQAMSQIAGYTLVNDITARDLVRRTDLPHLGTDWLQSKNAPGFLPTGPYLVPASFMPDPYAVSLSLKLNGETMQDDLVADMMCDIATQIAYISEYAQLLPGDIIWHRHPRWLWHTLRTIPEVRRCARGVCTGTGRTAGHLHLKCHGCRTGARFSGTD